MVSQELGSVQMVLNQSHEQWFVYSPLQCSHSEKWQVLCRRRRKIYVCFVIDSKVLCLQRSCCHIVWGSGLWTGSSIGMVERGLLALYFINSRSQTSINANRFRMLLYINQVRFCRNAICLVIGKSGPISQRLKHQLVKAIFGVCFD